VNQSKEFISREGAKAQSELKLPVVFICRLNISDEFVA
jgi:hypothetical protein